MSCLGILGVIFKNQYVGSLWFVCLTERMWPYGQTPPLEKCEQPDLKHPRAMLQNDICPQNSPRGGRVSPPGPRTIITRELSIALWHNYTRSIRNCSKNLCKTSFTCKSPFCASRGMPTATLKFEVNFMQNICKLQTFFVSTVFDRIIGPGTYFKFCVQGGCLIKEGRLFEGLRVCFYDVAFI